MRFWLSRRRRARLPASAGSRDVRTTPALYALDALFCWPQWTDPAPPDPVAHEDRITGR
ncbi:hypothetical protein [Nocardioides soli]|uniref:Uncharacterized protein n=1 Tax=Nocardioides soli TaxID=1036020 RepID=A0A7W4VV87_9ACTN|nr:hypothetical protein [Nocardioides soli]MBB3042384.1 hypothetical protein [Nocardioides soli]